MVTPADILEQEETFRTLYSELQGFTHGEINKEVYELAKAGYYDLRKFRELLEELQETKELLEEVKYEYSRYDRISDATDTLLEWLDEIKREVDVFCARRYPYMICKEFPTKEHIEFQNEMRSYGFTCGLITEGESEASFVRVIDSFTNCLHTLGLKLAEFEEKSEELEEETNGICRLIQEPENPILVEACRTFAHYVENNKHGYIHADIDKQRGYIYRNKIQFDVGGQAGHRAEIDLEDGVFRYYDPHDIRPYVIISAIESVLGLSCEHGYGDEFVCKGVREEHVEDLARLLAFVPSIDIHLNETVCNLKYECIDDCREECFEENEDCKNMCNEVCEDECEDYKDNEEEYEECMSDCYDDCMDRCCYDFCYDDCKYQAEEEVEENAIRAYELLLEGEIDYYDDLLACFREGC